MRIIPEGLTEDQIVLIGDARRLAKKGLHVPPENVNAVAQFTQSCIEALEKANAEIERLEKLLADASSSVSSYYWES